MTKKIKDEVILEVLGIFHRMLNDLDDSSLMVELKNRIEEEYIDKEKKLL